MSRKCSVCVHKDRDAIDHALIEGNTSFRSIASQHDALTASSIKRHKAHLPAQLVCEAGSAAEMRAQEKREAAETREERMLERLEQALVRTETTGDTKGLAMLIREWRGLREFQEKCAAGGFRPQGVTVAVQVNNGTSSSADDMSLEEERAVVRSALSGGVLLPSELRAIADQLESADTHLLEHAP